MLCFNTVYPRFCELMETSKSSLDNMSIYVESFAFQNLI